MHILFELFLLFQYKTWTTKSRHWSLTEAGFYDLTILDIDHMYLRKHFETTLKHNETSTMSIREMILFNDTSRHNNVSRNEFRVPTFSSRHRYSILLDTKVC